MAYQLALQAQKSRPVGASGTEMIETKSSKPVPKPRVGTRKSAVRGAGGWGASSPADGGQPPPWLRALALQGCRSRPPGEPVTCLVSVSALLCTPGAAAPRQSLLSLSHLHHPPSLPTAAVC